MYSRNTQNRDDDIIIPKHYGGSLFSGVQAEDTETRTHRYDENRPLEVPVKKSVDISPPEPEPEEAEQKPKYTRSNGRRLRMTRKKTSEKEAEKTSVEAGGFNLGGLLSKFSFDDLLLAGLMLLLSRDSGKSNDDILVLLALLMSR